MSELTREEPEERRRKRYLAKVNAPGYEKRKRAARAAKLSDWHKPAHEVQGSRLKRGR